MQLDTQKQLKKCIKTILSAKENRSLGKQEMARGTILQRRKRHEFSPVFFHLSYVFFLSTSTGGGGGGETVMAFELIQLRLYIAQYSLPNSSLQSSRPNLHKDRVEGVDSGRITRQPALYLSLYFIAL